MLSSFESICCKMNIKLHYLKSHPDNFPENLGDVSEEQGERFDKDIKIKKKHYQVRLDGHMMADYRRCLKRVCSNTHHKTKISEKEIC